MTDTNPPTIAAGPSNPTQNPYSGQPNSQRATFYANYSPWGNLWSSNYSGYATMAANPAMQINMPPYTAYPSQWPTQSNELKTTHKADSTALSRVASPPRVDTPPLPDPDTYRHWDDVLKRFLDKTKLTQCQRGLELDMLVLNEEWEQRMLPEALRELIRGLQVTSILLYCDFNILIPGSFRLSWIVYQARQKVTQKFKPIQAMPHLILSNSLSKNENSSISSCPMAESPNHSLL